MSGFTQRNVGNRAKSPSVEYKVSPCSSASAAKCASGTRLACTPGSARSSSNKSAWRSVGCGIQAVPHASQARTCRHASTIGSGRSNTRELVTRRRKASKLTQGSPTRVPSRAARQLPDQSTILWVESSSTDDSRLRGAQLTTGERISYLQFFDHLPLLQVFRIENGTSRTHGCRDD